MDDDIFRHTASFIIMVYFGDIVSLTEGLFLLWISVFIRNYVLLLIFVLLQRVIIQSVRTDFIPPRGGARGQRGWTCESLLSILWTLTLHPGNSVLAFRFTMGESELFVSCSLVVAVSILAVPSIQNARRLRTGSIEFICAAI